MNHQVSCKRRRNSSIWDGLSELHIVDRVTHNIKWLIDIKMNETIFSPHNHIIVIPMTNARTECISSFVYELIECKTIHKSFE